MIFWNVSKVGKELNWFRNKSTIFGLRNNYFFRIGDGMGYKYVEAILPESLSEDHRTRLGEELEVNKSIGKYSESWIDGRIVSIRFNETFLPTSKAKLINAVDSLCDVFSKLGIEETNHSFTNNLKDNLSYYDVTGSGFLLDEKSAREIANEYYEQNRLEENEQKNYAVGFAGSMVFSLAGVFVWVLIAVFLNRLLSVMSMVIGFLGIKGYDYFKGIRGGFTNWIIILSNILSVLLANFLIVATMLYRAGVISSQGIWYEFLNNPEAQEIFNTNTAISFVLSFFVWIYLFFILKHEKPMIRKAWKVGEKVV